MTTNVQSVDMNLTTTHYKKEVKYELCYKI